MAQWSWKDSGFLSPVRRNKDNTCVYRALCDTMDARVRIATGGSFPGRFSARRMLKKEAAWVNVPGGRRRKVMEHFVRNKLPLLVAEKTPQPVTYHLASCEMLELNTEEKVKQVKKLLEDDGPVIGTMELRDDYLNGGIYYARGGPTTVEQLKEKDPSLNVPPPPDDVDTTSSSDGEKPPSEKKAKGKEEEEEKKKKAQGSGEKDMVKKLRFTSHAVCVIGYRKVQGVDCFECQENQGKHRFDDGFRDVAVSAVKAVYVPVVKELELE